MEIKDRLNTEFCPYSKENTDITGLNKKETNEQLDYCDTCSRYTQCQKVAELNDQLVNFDRAEEIQSQLIKVLPLGTKVRIIKRNPAETIYYEDDTVMEIVSQRYLPRAYGYQAVTYTLKNTAENTILELDYNNFELEELPLCTSCGSYIEGDTCQDEDENIICEDCLINKQAKRMGLE